MTVAFFDCFSGAAGDMIVASLLDAGADAERFREGLASLGIDGYSLDIERVQKQGLAATRFHVGLDRTREQPQRHLSEIIEIIHRSPLGTAVKEKASRIFTRLGEAEARVHGISVERVHFHEVGAVDAIVDVVGAALAVDLLGIDRLICSPIPTGSGTIDCRHGTLPVPAPATAELLRGVPLEACHERGELITPTGAAILTTLASSFGALPSMRITSIGYGAGTRDGGSRPNVLRVLLGEAIRTGDVDQVAVLETNIDDATPEVVGYCMERLLAEGALDVFAVPIHMKKCRTGVLLTVLCEPTEAGRLERILFAETPTFGVRRHLCDRTKLRRRFETVATPFGDVRMKIGEADGIVTTAPEYEDCRSAASEHGVALSRVMAAANRAWTQRSEQ